MEGRPRVLVVDDDEDFAQVLAETISDRGWEGHPCSDTADALERILDGSYSAVFIDVVLAGKRRGIELLRRSIAHDPRRPVVLMSGFDACQEDIMEALELGPVMFVQKPISRPDLDSALQMFRDRLPGAPKRRAR
jgi:two-component system response regulator RegA